MLSIDKLSELIEVIFADFSKAYELAKIRPTQFHIDAAVFHAHLQPIVNQILESKLPNIDRLKSLNILVSYFNLDVDWFLKNTPEQLEITYEDCESYLSLEPCWSKKELILCGYIRDVMRKLEDY